MKSFPYLLNATITAALALAFASSAAASDITIEGYITGGASLELNGELATGIVFAPINEPAQDTDTSWYANPTADFISFIDDSETPGFYISLYVGDFAYTGDSPTQQYLEAENMKLIGTLSEGKPAPPTLYILPESCEDATEETLIFNESFTSPEKNYTLTANNYDQKILTSTTSCLVVGRFTFDKVTLTYPGGTQKGNYNAQLVFTMNDGAPLF